MISARVEEARDPKNHYIAATCIKSLFDSCGDDVDRVTGAVLLADVVRLVHIGVQNQVVQVDAINNQTGVLVSLCKALAQRV
jgi:hypothetical protein